MPILGLMRSKGLMVCALIKDLYDGASGENSEILMRYPWAIYHLCPKSDGSQLTWLR
jgi:hypothetical protein